MQKLFYPAINSWCWLRIVVGLTGLGVLLGLVASITVGGVGGWVVAVGLALIGAYFGFRMASYARAGHHCAAVERHSRWAGTRPSKEQGDEAMRRCTVWKWLVSAVFVLPAGCHAVGQPGQQRGSNMPVHYLEIVCRDVAAQCAALERVHGLSFGPAVADLGHARVAEVEDGSRIGVRAPLADHEQPIVRTYLAVDDIARAVDDAEAAGAVIAYPPTRQGETGTWAIYILGEVQIGLWQR